METQSKKRGIRKLFITALITLLLLGMFTVELGAGMAAHVVVTVRNRYYRPVPYAHVSVGNKTCRGSGYGTYTLTTSLGCKAIYVSGVRYQVNFRSGGHNFVNAYIR